MQWPWEKFCTVLWCQFAVPHVPEPKTIFCRYLPTFQPLFQNKIFCPIIYYSPKIFNYLLFAKQFAHNFNSLFVIRECYTTPDSVNLMHHSQFTQKLVTITVINFTDRIKNISRTWKRMDIRKFVQTKIWKIYDNNLRQTWCLFSRTIIITTRRRCFRSIVVEIFQPLARAFYNSQNKIFFLFVIHFYH